MNIVFWIDLGAMGLLLAFWTVSGFRRVPLAKSGLVLHLIALTVLVSLLLDMAGTWRSEDGVVLVRRGLRYASILVSLTCCFLHAVYIRAVLGLFPNSKRDLCIQSLPFLLSLIVSILCYPFLKGLRTPAWMLSPLVLCIYVAYVTSMRLIWRSRKGLAAVQCVLLALDLTMLGAVMLSEVFLSTIRLTPFALSLSLLLLFLNIENNEEIVDGDTGLPNDQALRHRAEESLRPGRRYTIVVFGIQNYQELSELLPEWQVRTMVADIASTLKALTRFGRVYRVFNETFAVALDQPDPKKIRKVAQAGMAAFQKEDPSNFGFQGACSVVRYPEDFSSVEEYFLVLRLLHNQWNSSRGLTAGTYALRQGAMHRKLALAYLVRNLQKTTQAVRLTRIYDQEKGNASLARCEILLSGDDVKQASGREYLPLAVQNGKVWDMTVMMLGTACRLLSSGRLDSLHVERLAVSLDMSQWMQYDLADLLHAECAKAGIEPRRIVLGMDAPAWHRVGDLLEAQLARLKEEGVDVMVSGWGRGYTNLFAKPKTSTGIISFDPRFLTPDSTRHGSRVMIETLLPLLSGEGYAIQLYGVRSLEDAAYWMDKGVRYISGPVLGRPVTLELKEEEKP